MVDSLSFLFKHIILLFVFKRDLVEELGLDTYNWTFKKPYRHESRGIFTNHKEELIKAYPALRKSEFGNITSSEMFAYVWEDTSQIADFATLRSFVSHRISPEGAEFLSEVRGRKGLYTDFISPAGYYELLEETADFTGEYVRPVGGMSSIINALADRLKLLGASVYTCNGVNRIEKNTEGYKIHTDFNKVNAEKVVVALPPVHLKNVRGTIATQLRDSRQFLSLLPISAFKGAALFSNNTWSHLEAHQNFISNSDCLEQSFLHMWVLRIVQSIMWSLST